MKLFSCQNCGQVVYFENRRCERCGHRLGYLAEGARLVAVEEAGTDWAVTGAPEGDPHYRFCANAEMDLCNWLIPAESPETLCAACHHNRTIPDLTIEENLAAWRKFELAKHRLFYSLMRFHLPLPTKIEDAEAGLAFDFLADPPRGPKILTGHDHGLITINLKEADDSQREKLRLDMGEPYRTLLGHFRHETGHYYWDRLVRDGGQIEAFRAVFGDETRDYGEALQTHYANGPVANWQENFISSYAASHPWEDFAETWAHHLHIVDTLETAAAFGLRIRPATVKAPDMHAILNFDPYDAAGVSVGQLVEAWLPLTFAMNSINRAMGQPDLYPFILSPPVIEKMNFIHGLLAPVKVAAAA